MKYARHILFGILISLSTFAYGQDLHFTNYEYAPLNFNPGLTGSFSGSVRLGGVYRDQFRSFFNQAYSTNMFYVDSPFMKGLKDNHWIGFGFIFYGDKAGLFGLKKSGMTGSAAYHIGLDKDYKNVLTFGFQYGGEGIKTNDEAVQALLDDNAFGGTSVDMSLFQSYEGSYSDANFGILYKSKVSPTSNFETGIAMYRLLNKDFRNKGGNTTPNPNPNPNPNPTPTVQNKIGRRINAHAKYRFATNDRFALEPAFYASLQGKFSDISVQMRSEYLLREDFLLKLGAGYRLGDAFEILLGARYKDWHFGVSYDLTVSSASVYDKFFGGIEIGAYKIFNIYKRPNPDKVFFCPKF